MNSNTLNEYTLKWNGHIQHLKNKFHELLLKNYSCDVTIYVEGQKIGAHKIFLSACSKYFDRLFKEFKDERPIIVLKDVKFNILNHILNFVYNGETTVELENLNLFLEAADFLEIEGLTENNISRKRKICGSKSETSSYKQSSKLVFDVDMKNVFSTEQLEANINEREKVVENSSNVLIVVNDDNNLDPCIGNDTNFSKPPETGKYSIDEPQKDVEWLSDYEFINQNRAITSQSTIDKNSTITSSDDNIDSEELKQIKQKTYFIKKIKTEPSNYVDENSVKKIPSFDQTDFANSLDAEIDISDDSDDDKLEKQLMKTSLASIDEKGFYECKICGKSYVKKDSLKKHFAVHVNNTSCYICGKVLSRKTHLIRHLRIHGISSS